MACTLSRSRRARLLACGTLLGLYLFAVKVLYLPPRVAAMLEGVLRHCTDMTIKHQMTDSHGQSEIGFAFSHVLGFRLLPRLKPRSEERRVGKECRSR